MLLAVDIGNSEVTFGAFEGNVLRGAWHLRTASTRTDDEYGVLITSMMALGGCPAEGVRSILIGSVVPGLNRTFEKSCTKYLGHEPQFVTSQMDTGIHLDVDRPHEVGADRVINAVAAFEKYGTPAIVVDFGTATTFDVVLEGGRYVGGAILPGIQISMDALFGRAALLSRVELVKPASFIGRNTATMLQSGFYNGFLGQMERVLEQMITELGQTPTVIATGGLAGLIASDSDLVAIIEPHLTLIGLQVLHQRLCRGPSSQ